MCRIMLRTRYVRAPQTLFPVAIALSLVAANQSARADVNLVTIPSRDETQLTIYNSEDITMVRETRLLTLKPGINRIQFAWTNTLIDPTSIEFRILDHQDQVDLVDTTYPSGRTDALQWNISSTISGKVPVEIRYFTSGITWAADYVGIANEDETKLALTGYVRVTNTSGEIYDNAQTRMVVGKINLVEMFAELANCGCLANGRRTVEKDRVIYRKSVSHAAKQAEELSLRDELSEDKGINKKLDDAKKIVKEGLSEYFLFTIEGREDIKDKEPKRLQALKVVEVPLECLYKLTDRTGDAQFTKFYRFKNAKLLDDHGQPRKLPAMENLGLSPLPNGAVRLFFEYKSKDLAYVGGTETKYVPIGDRVEVNVGLDHDITIHRRTIDQKTSNVVVRQYKRRLDDEFVMYYDLTDFDETSYFEEEIVSGKPNLAKVEVERQFDANVFVCGPEGKARGWDGNEPGAYIDLHDIAGRVERVDARHVKYYLDSSCQASRRK